MSPRPSASAAGRARPKRFRSPAWARFRANRRGWWSLRILCALYALSLCAELLCNDRPLVLRVRGRTFFPALSSCTQDELLGDGVRRPVRDFAPILARPDARALLALSDPEAQLKVFAEMKKDHLSVRKIEDMVKQLSGGASVKTKTGTRIRQKGSNLSADYNQLREGLRKIFKTRVEMTCSESGKGKISIPFSGEAELERIIELLDKLRE